MSTSPLERIATHGLLFVACAVVLYPLVSIVLLALNPPGTPVSGVAFPTNPSLGGFSTAWGAGALGPSLIASFEVAVPVVLISVVLSILAGYAFGTMTFTGSGLLFFVLLLGIVFPYEALITPLYYDFRALGLTNSLVGLMLPEIGFGISFGTLWMRGVFRAAPKELFDAARIDGAGTWTILWRVLTPGAMPAILALMVFEFLNTWNEFLLALVLVQRDDLRTAPVVLAFFAAGFRTTDRVVAAAAALLVAMPVVLVYFALQRQFHRSMMSGALSDV